jgi:hypothetical protein
LAVPVVTAVRPDVDVPLEIAKGLITLAVAVLVTGVLSFILAERNRELALHEERVRVLAAARQDFKAAYEQVHTARFFLKVHPSAKTLDEQISTLNGARERLQRVQRERRVMGLPPSSRPGMGERGAVDGSDGGGWVEGAAGAAA